MYFSRILYTEDMCLYINQFINILKFQNELLRPHHNNDKEIRLRVIQVRKCIASLNGILWSEEMRKERKLDIYNALIKNS
jgi:hypothetical protein